MADNEYLRVDERELLACVRRLKICDRTDLSLTVLKKAYRALIRQKHPDKAKNDKNDSGKSKEENAAARDAEAAEITRAYRILSDCVSNNRIVPGYNGQPSTPEKPNVHRYSKHGTADGYQMDDDDFGAFFAAKDNRNRKQRKKRFPSPMETAMDNFSSGLSMSFNNGYTYDKSDWKPPNCQQFEMKFNIAAKPGGYEECMAFTSILPEDFKKLATDQASISDLRLHEYRQQAPNFEEIYDQLRLFDEKPGFNTLLEQNEAFVYMMWAAEVQGVLDFYNVEFTQTPNSLLRIRLQGMVDNDIENDRLCRDAYCEVSSLHTDNPVRLKGVIKKCVWDCVDVAIHENGIKDIGKLFVEGEEKHRCNFSLEPCVIPYVAYAEAIKYVRVFGLVDQIYPTDPKFDQPLAEYVVESDERIEADQVALPSGLELNNEQHQAIDTIVNGTCRPYPFVLFGPPGTGKTKTLIESIRRIVSKNSNRVLVCAPSNAACDVVAKALLDAQFLDPKYIFRLYATSYENFRMTDEFTAISCKAGDKMGIPPVYNLQVFKVIIVTLVSSSKLAKCCAMRGYFTHILIDEAGQAFDFEAWVPISMLANPTETTVALFGDPMQLGSVCPARVLQDLENYTSMLERLTNIPAYDSKNNDRRLLVHLRQNYRTHPFILKPASMLFYDGMLRPKTNNDRLYRLCALPILPKIGFPMVFVSTQGSKEEDHISRSRTNNEEVNKAVKYVRDLIKSDIKSSDIGIVSPYKAQTAMVNRKLMNYGITDITVASVERFQGSERRVIIALTTRTDNLGFIASPKRLNTAITRAQELLIIFGKEDLLGYNPYWSKLIFYIAQNGGFVSANASHKFFHMIAAGPQRQREVERLAAEQETLSITNGIAGLTTDENNPPSAERDAEARRLKVIFDKTNEGEYTDDMPEDSWNLKYDEWKYIDDWVEEKNKRTREREHAYYDSHRDSDEYSDIDPYAYSTRSRRARTDAAHEVRRPTPPPGFDDDAAAADSSVPPGFAVREKRFAKPVRPPGFDDLPSSSSRRIDYDEPPPGVPNRFVDDWGDYVPNSSQPSYGTRKAPVEKEKPHRSIYYDDYEDGEFADGNRFVEHKHEYGKPQNGRSVFFDDDRNDYDDRLPLNRSTAPVPESQSQRRPARQTFDDDYRSSQVDDYYDRRSGYDDRNHDPYREEDVDFGSYDAFRRDQGRQEPRRQEQRGYDHYADEPVDAYERHNRDDLDDPNWRRHAQEEEQDEYNEHRESHRHRRREIDPFYFNETGDDEDDDYYAYGNYDRGYRPSDERDGYRYYERDDLQRRDRDRDRDHDRAYDDYDREGYDDNYYPQDDSHARSDDYDNRHGRDALYYREPEDYGAHGQPSPPPLDSGASTPRPLEELGDEEYVVSLERRRNVYMDYYDSSDFESPSTHDVQNGRLPLNSAAAENGRQRLDTVENGLRRTATVENGHRRLDTVESDRQRQTTVENGRQPLREVFTDTARQSLRSEEIRQPSRPTAQINARRQAPADPAFSRWRDRNSSESSTDVEEVVAPRAARGFSIDDFVFD